MHQLKFNSINPYLTWTTWIQRESKQMRLDWVYIILNKSSG